MRGGTLVTGGSDGSVRVWSLERFCAIHRLAAHDNSVTSLQFDDTRIVSGGSDGRVKVWDLKTGHLVRELVTQGEAVWRVAFEEEKCVAMALKNGRTVMEVSRPQSILTSRERSLTQFPGVVFLSSSRATRRGVDVASETETRRRASSGPTAERVLAGLPGVRLRKRDTGRGYARRRPFDSAPPAERPDFLPRRIKRHYHRCIARPASAYFYLICFLLADTPLRICLSQTEPAGSCRTTGGNDKRDTRYPGSTTQRERQRDTRVFLGHSQNGSVWWHCYGVSNLHTVSMDSAKISGMQQQTMHWEGGFFKPGFKV